jgi:3-dehydroquinate dehydratase type I
MKRPRICAVIVNSDIGAIRKVEPFIELFEVRIDLIGSGWPKLVEQLQKPWIACNRSIAEGGSWRGSELERVEELLKAIELGAEIVDIELVTRNLQEIIPLIKSRAKCLLSFHDLNGTPPIKKMRETIQRQLDMGADICKLITTAYSFNDNLPTIQLIAEFPKTRVVSFAMGSFGFTSRILCPLVGGDFTYASIAEGKESAPGQITAINLRKVYKMVQD